MGARDERVSDLFFTDEHTTAPSEIGQARFVDGRFVVKDDTGSYDPREIGEGTDAVGRLLFTTDGGLVYSTAGDVLIKATA